MKTEELKRLAEAATPGPWVAWPIGDHPPLFSIATETGLGLLTTTTEAENEREFAAVFEDEDAAYIAAANPAAILELIAEIEYLRGKNREHFYSFIGCNEELKRVTKQRDELLASLRKIKADLMRQRLHGQESGVLHAAVQAEGDAEEAIAKAGGAA